MARRCRLMQVLECFGWLWKFKMLFFFFFCTSACAKHTGMTANSVIRQRQQIRHFDGSLAFISWKVRQSCQAFFRTFVDGMTLDWGLRLILVTRVRHSGSRETHVRKPSVIYGTKEKPFVLCSFVHVAGISHSFVPWCIHSLSINSLQLRI